MKTGQTKRCLALKKKNHDDEKEKKLKDNFGVFRSLGMNAMRREKHLTGIRPCPVMPECGNVVDVGSCLFGRLKSIWNER